MAGVCFGVSVFQCNGRYILHMPYTVEVYHMYRYIYTRLVTLILFTVQHGHRAQRKSTIANFPHIATTLINDPAVEDAVAPHMGMLGTSWRQVSYCIVPYRTVSCREKSYSVQCTACNNTMVAMLRECG